MIRSKLVGASVLAGCLSLSAFAADKKDGAAMPTPTPSKELEAWMKPIEGSWSCESKWFAGAMGPGSPAGSVKSTAKFIKDKDSRGMWYRGEVRMPKTAMAPAMTGTMLMSYDETHKVFTHVSWNDAGCGGTGFGTITADTINWSGAMMMNGKPIKTRDSFTKEGGRITHKFEADLGNGFQPMGENTCTKDTVKS